MLNVTFIMEVKMEREKLLEIIKLHKEWLNTRYSSNVKGGRADLCGANLRDADLCDVIYNEFTAFFASCCPQEGSFIGQKKASDKIVKLEICYDAKRSSATSRKCRCSKAKVLSITNLDGTDSDLTEVKSDYDGEFVYKVGEISEVSNFDKNRWCECSTGIHFFITRDEAVRY